MPLALSRQCETRARVGGPAPANCERSHWRPKATSSATQNQARNGFTATSSVAPRRLLDWPPDHMNSPADPAFPDFSSMSAGSMADDRG